MLEPTQSYAILPGGPTGHKDELSHYNWSGRGFENPQVLPDASPVPAAPSQQMAGFGCRGTYVPLSFAVLPERTLEGLSFEVSDLRSETGEMPAAAIDIRTVATWWRPWNQDNSIVPRLMNELLLHDPGFAVPAEGKVENIYRDADLGSDAETLQPVTIPGGTVRQFYVLAKIPADASAGVYAGKIVGSAKGRESIRMQMSVEVVPFDLEPTPYAYSFYYRAGLRTAGGEGEEGLRAYLKTPAQMEADLVSMAEHGCNTANDYSGQVRQTDDGWDFSRFDLCLDMVVRAGLTRSPFTWGAHGGYWTPAPGKEGAPQTMEEVLKHLEALVPAVNAHCDEKGYPRPALLGIDEASGDRLRQAKRAYAAANEAGGLVNVACYPSYWDEIGDALSLPTIYGGAQTSQGEAAMRASQKLGYECWIYNCPATGLTASPSVYRRRYGLAMWRNGEQGAMPWNYFNRQGGTNLPVFLNRFDQPVYSMAYPTWDGKPIDTIIYEAWREGIYDTRYMATLEKYLKEAKAKKAAPELVAGVEKWLGTFSVNDDLNAVRGQMKDLILSLMEATKPK